MFALPTCISWLAFYEIYSYTHPFSIFQVFDSDFISYTHFTHIAASDAVTDYVTI